MTDDATGPAEILPTDARSCADAAGATIDMSAFEAVLRGPDAVGPEPEWALYRPGDGELVVRSEDEALAIARAHPDCHLVRRFVPPWRDRHPREDRSST